jgi:hypothetical protein
MRTSKKVQVLIHKNYESIKLGLLLFTALMVVFIMLSVAQENSSRAEERNRQAVERSTNAENGRQVLKRALDELKADNERQTQLIACLLIIHGENIKITPTDQVNCRKSLDNVKLSGETTPASPIPQSSSSTQPATSNESSQQPPAAQEPGIIRGAINSVTNAAQSALNGLTRLIPQP